MDFVSLPFVLFSTTTLTKGVLNVPIARETKRILGVMMIQYLLQAMYISPGSDRSGTYSSHFFNKLSVQFKPYYEKSVLIIMMASSSFGS